VRMQSYSVESIEDVVRDTGFTLKIGDYFELSLTGISAIAAVVVAGYLLWRWGHKIPLVKKLHPRTKKKRG